MARLRGTARRQLDAESDMFSRGRVMPLWGLGVQPIIGSSRDPRDDQDGKPSSTLSLGSK